MKVFFVILLLSAGMFVLIISLDLLMHYPLSGILNKELIPFKVTEEVEITTLIMFGLYFIVKAVIGIVKKKLQKSST
ncbi:hypothetical protein HPT25_18365 [Bacillus sp. BRMEA1]|uniref:hypothetical protein n=1 Tax=Neobacillus endophyticus TaxID=2738405 RepID=UPI0015670DA2|nr:hypothetical protein [Neobacillus endophyticus]NRD79328.1 hypothetical protein [Neobacillus endophyticus]